MLTTKMIVPFLRIQQNVYADGWIEYEDARAEYEGRATGCGDKGW